MKLGNLVEEQVLLKPLKLTIKRKAKPNVVMYFDTPCSVRVFHDFIIELIKAVKRKETQR